MSYLKLGDFVKRVTTAVGIKPCAPCEERRTKLNKLIPLPGWMKKRGS